MTTFRDFYNGLRKLEIPPSHPVIAHASLSAFGEVHGGAETVLGALLGAFHTLVMPSFTYKTMLIPETGPQNNACTYGSGKDYQPHGRVLPTGHACRSFDGCHCRDPAYTGWRAAFFSPDPILYRDQCGDYFRSANAGRSPWRPLGHYGKQMAGFCSWEWTIPSTPAFIMLKRAAGRKQFIRWALSPAGVVECTGFPGCSAGFQALRRAWATSPALVQVGPGIIQAFPLKDLVDTVYQWIEEDPLALLCGREDCERCNAVREAVAVSLILFP